MVLKLGVVKNPDVGDRGRKLWHLLYLTERVSPALFRASLSNDQEERKEHGGDFFQSLSHSSFLEFRLR